MKDLARQLKYLLTGRDKRNALILFGLMIIGAVAEVLGVGAVPAFVGVVAMPERMLEIAPVRAVYDGLEMDSPRDMVLWAAVALIFVFLVKNVLLAALTYAKARYTTHRQLDLSNRLFRAYMHAPYAFHLQRNTAELLRNTNMEAATVATGVLMPILTLSMEFMTLGMIFALLFALEPLVALLTFSVLGAVTVAFFALTKKRIRTYSKEEQLHRKESMQTVNQGLGGIKSTKILGREDFFLRSYRASALVKARITQLRELLTALPRLYLETIGVVGVLGVSALLILQGRPLQTIVPTLTLLAAAIVRLMPSFARISTGLTSLHWGVRALDVVYADLHELEPADRSRESRSAAGAEEVLAFERILQLEEVRYSYPASDRPAVDSVSLSIPRHSAVAFVGPSGAGKSTLVDIILGLLTPDAGMLRIDGVPLADRLASWQRTIGYIPQSIYLTDDTLRRNVAFGLPDSEIRDDAVWNALETSQLADLARSLPRGLDTIVGERGVRLSGGERQRVGIARALYPGPDVLVMDEATSSLDNRTERNILDLIARIRTNHTLIVIAHRLSTVRSCDTLFYLDGGRVIAQGSFEELLATCPDFAVLAGTAQGLFQPSTHESRVQGVPGLAARGPG